MIIPRILLKQYLSSSTCVHLKGVVELVLPNARSDRSLLSNGKSSTSRERVFITTGE